MSNRTAPRTLLVVAVAALVLASCGGGTRLGPAEFTERANQECSSLEKASDAFRMAQDPSFTGSDVQRFVHQVAHRLRELVDNIDQLSPPESMEHDVDELLDLLSEYADGLDELADKTAPSQTFQAVLAESPVTVNHLNELATRATVLVGELDFVSCILPG